MPADANSMSAFWIVAASSVICVLALEVGTYFAELPDGLVKMSSRVFFCWISIIFSSIKKSQQPAMLFTVQ